MSRASLLVLVLLVACGDPAEGDRIRIRRGLLCGMTMGEVRELAGRNGATLRVPPPPSSESGELVIDRDRWHFRLWFENGRLVRYQEGSPDSEMNTVELCSK